MFIQSLKEGGDHMGGGSEAPLGVLLEALGLGRFAGPILPSWAVRAA